MELAWPRHRPTAVGTAVPYRTPGRPTADAARTSACFDLRTNILLGCKRNINGELSQTTNAAPPGGALRQSPAAQAPSDRERL